MAQISEKLNTWGGRHLTLMASRDSYHIDGLTPLSSLDRMHEEGLGILILWGELYAEHSRSSELPFLLVCTLKDVTFHFYLRPSGEAELYPRQLLIPVQLPPLSGDTVDLLDDLWTHMPKGRLLWLLELSKYWVQKPSSANPTAWQRRMSGTMLA